MFDPRVGEFLSEDPVDLTDDVNPHRYLKNNPTNAVDPTGLHKFLAYGIGYPVHQNIVKEAAWNAGLAVGVVKHAIPGGYEWKEGYERFIEGLQVGSTYPDNPDGPVKMAEVALSKQPRRAASGLGAWTTYESHFGNLQYWHAMTTPVVRPNTLKDDFLTPKEMVEKMVKWVTDQYATASKQDNSYQAGVELGKGLHTIADSYALSHAARVWRNGVPMEIELFQNYSEQNHDRHELADITGVGLREAFGDEQRAAYKAAIDRCEEVIKMFLNKRPVEELKRWLTDGNLAPFAISPECKVGESDGRFK